SLLSCPHASALPRHLHSFPTRRSSDLPDRDALQRRGRACAARRAEGCARDDRRSAGSLHDSSERRAAATSAEAAHDIESERADRSEEHTSELQSRENLVCRLLLEKKKY